MEPEWLRPDRVLYSLTSLELWGWGRGGGDQTETEEYVCAGNEATP